VPQDVQVPQKLEKLRDVPFPGGVDLQFLIKELAKDLDLNVLFEGESFRSAGAPRTIKIELKNVTAAKALDYVFLQENLFFQKVGPRTILVAQTARRGNFQQLVLRTFYLANASPKDVAKIVQTAIPAQPGRTPTIVLTDDATNSITIRDTEENIRLMSKLISSLDKDRAEVVMDVAIYEVNKNDLLKFGSQLGDENSLITLGGSNRGLIGLGGNNNYGGTGASYIARSLGAAIAIPSINLVAFQNKQNSKLIASTQIHAFNNEDSSARIGQRVPVRTATFQTGTNNNSGVVSDVINYEQVGLTLKFKPIVFPNQDVQVAMEIESKDVTGASSLTPTFTERTIKGTARIQNNKTLLLASVAQGVESNGRSGIPLLGLIPILGRLFTAPTKDNRQVDIVIAVTPRVIRAPAILPEDEVERPTGSIAVPTSGSLEAMIMEDEREELLAAARRVPNVAQVQLPDQKTEGPTYVKADASQNSAAMEKPVGDQAAMPETPKTNDALANLRPIDSGVRTLELGKTADTSANVPVLKETSLKVAENAAPDSPRTNAPVAGLQIAPLATMKAGEKAKIAITVNSESAFRSALLGLKFDDKKLAIRSVSFGDVFGAGMANTPATPFLNQNGKMFVSLASAKDGAEGSSGILAYIEIEALADGVPEIIFEKDVLNFLTSDGRNFTVKY
jgi:general secretion pathway protein D